MISGLTPNKYKDRLPAMSKRFGRLKSAHGFGRKYAYHSIRHTVAIAHRGEHPTEGETFLIQCDSHALMISEGVGFL